MRTREFRWLAVAALLSVAVLLLPPPSGLTPEAHRLIALFLGVMVLWVTEALPVAVTALLSIALQPVFAVADPPRAMTTFMSPVFFFLVAMFCIALVITGSGLDRRFALRLLSASGTSTSRVLLAFMVGTAAISTIMSDVPACAIWMALALGILDRMGAKPGSSSFGRALMMGIPIASLIGGVATPAGSAINVLGVSLIERATEGAVRVSFLGWMLIGVPMVVIMTPIAWWVLLRFCKPETATIGDIGVIHRERASLGPTSAQERKAMALLGLMIVLWIMGTWYRQLDTTLVAIGGAIAMFLPGIRLLTWEKAQHGIGWPVILVVGAVTSLGDATLRTGLAQWLVDSVLGGLVSWPPVVILLVISAFTAVIHLVLPVNPVIVAVLVPPVALLATAAGQNPAIYTLPIVFSASCAFLLPLDAVPLVTYPRGYYRMFDMFRPGLMLTICWIVVLTLLMQMFGPRLLALSGAG